MANSRNQELRILLPSLPGDDLDDAARLLEALLPARRSHVRRLYVHRPVEADFFIPDTYARFHELAQLEMDAENATRVETEHQMKALAAEGFKVSAEVIRGTPTEEILREARFWRADCVAVRTRSAAAQDRKLGGMASALLHHASCPVLTYHAIPRPYRARRILIPTDFSKPSRTSADWGLALAAITGSEPVLLHVIANWSNRHGIDQEELAEMAKEELERWRVRVHPVLPNPVKEAARIVVARSAARGILSFAQEQACDLIVMSSTGISAVREVLIGSNTRKVVRWSDCPVLVIPASNRVDVEDFLKKAGERKAIGAAEAVSAGGGRPR